MSDLLTPAELAAIAEREAKAVPSVVYFVNSPDTGFDEYPTLKEALDAAEETISNYRDEAMDGWNEEVTSIRVGIITHDVEQFDVKHRKDCGEDENWPCPDCDEMCDYRMSSDGDLLALLDIACADRTTLLRHIAALEAREAILQPTGHSEFLSEGCFPEAPLEVQPGPNFKPTRDIDAVLPPAPATDVDALLAEAEHWLHQILGDTTRSIIQRLATALRESRAREVAEPYRHALEQRLVCSNLPLLTGNADADLMRFVFHEQELALSPEAGVIAELKEQRDTALSWTATYTNMDVYRRCLAAAIARAEKAESLCAEYRKKADYCAVCGQTIVDPPCPMAGDEMNPCTWPAKCLTRVMQARKERDAAIARAEQAEAQLALCAENTTAADLAQEVECLKAEKEALREALARVREEAKC